MEKHLLRSAFDGSGLLPANIVWRSKEAFSDGVTCVKKSLFQIIDDLVKYRVSEEELEAASQKYSHCTPRTKEAYYYRYIILNFSSSPLLPN